ncbi:MAG: DUF4296 domain-containing protein [Flavobacteriales bacterium]|jgi:hypothetical protein
MNKRLLFLFAIVALLQLFSACESAQHDSAPAGLISEEKYSDVLTDIRLLEGVYAGDFQRVDTSEYAIGTYYEQLFAKHGIQRAGYLESTDYYARHPEIMLRIETEVSRKLELMSAEAPQ